MSKASKQKLSAIVEGRAEARCIEAFFEEPEWRAVSLEDADAAMLREPLRRARENALEHFRRWKAPDER